MSPAPAGPRTGTDCARRTTTPSTARVRAVVEGVVRRCRAVRVDAKNLAVRLFRSCALSERIGERSICAVAVAHEQRAVRQEHEVADVWLPLSAAMLSAEAGSAPHGGVLTLPRMIVSLPGSATSGLDGFAVTRLSRGLGSGVVRVAAGLVRVTRCRRSRCRRSRDRTRDPRTPGRRTCSPGR